METDANLAVSAMASKPVRDDAMRVHRLHADEPLVGQRAYYGLPSARGHSNFAVKTLAIKPVVFEPKFAGCGVADAKQATPDSLLIRCETLQNIRGQMQRELLLARAIVAW